MPWVFDPAVLLREALGLRELGLACREHATAAETEISQVPSQAGTSQKAATGDLESASGSLLASAEDLRVRAAWLELANRTDDPMMLAAATLPAPPRFRPGVLDSAGFAWGSLASLVGTHATLVEGGAELLDLAGRDLLQEANRLIHTTTDPVLQRQLAESIWSLAKDGEQLKQTALMNAELGARLQLASQAMNAAGAVLAIYQGYQGSSAQSTEGRFISGGLNAFFTAPLPLAAFDLASGGAGGASADFYVVTVEEAFQAVVHLDSSRLLGPGTSAWHAENLDGSNGWLMQSYAQTGEYIAPAASSVLDKVHPGFPFDGDGSVNWAPDFVSDRFGF